jgi:hypothetical protein
MAPLHPNRDCAGLPVMKTPEQARMLADGGEVIYFLPEKGDGKHPDAVIDGRITELKTVEGKLTRVWESLTMSGKNQTNP